jgi:3D (Asp-Asp-Asp) domain-containing protein
MKKLIVTTAVTAVLLSGMITEAHTINTTKDQVEQLRYKYNMQLNQNKKLEKNVEKVTKQTKELQDVNDALQSKVNEKDQQLQSQSEQITQLKKQIDESPRWMTFSASAYTVGDDYTSGKWGNKTASGTVPSQGRTIAVDNNLIPLGTKLRVEFPEPYSYLNGTYIAEDTGNAIKGHKVDLYLSSINACLNFGVRDIKISIIN